MGKQSRLRKERKTRSEVSAADFEIMLHALSFFDQKYGELEPITPLLIGELLQKGWTLEPLQEAQAMGLLYSRTRNSFTDGKLYGTGLFED